jgi:hypothetical protein
MWESIALLPIEDYDQEECIANGLVRSTNPLPFKPQLHLFKDIFEQDCSFRDDAEIILSTFHRSCGITFDIVRMHMLSYLFRTHIRTKKNVFSYFGLELTRLSWVYYHGLEGNTKLVDSCIGHTCSSKSKSSDMCLICHALEKVETDSHYKITMTPGEMGSNRVGQGINDTGCHFVLWSLEHNAVMDPIHAMYYSKARYSDVHLYIHGEMQYGHPHIHAIGGDYFTIRTRDLMNHCQNSINLNVRIEKTDFFHPIGHWFSMLDADDRHVFITCFCILICRVKVKLDFSTLPDFYWHTYRSVYLGVENKLLELMSSYYYY